MKINKKIWFSLLIFVVLITIFIGWNARKQTKEREIVFGWMTDVHLGDNNHAEKLSTLGDDAIKRVMPQIIKKQAEFMVVTGDMIDNFHKTHEEVINFHKKVKELYDNYPFRTYYVIGNHDVETTTKQEVVDIYQLPAKNYTFQERGITFIVLDQQFNPDGSSYDSGKHHIAGAVPVDQVKWFEKELEKAPGKVIVLMHQPIYSVAEEDGVSGELYTHNGQLIQKAMEKSGKVLVVLTGHKQPTRAERDRTFNGVRHLMVPSAIFKETRLSYGIIKVDLKKKRVKFEYYADKNQKKIDRQYDEITEKCKGPDEEEDYYAIMKIKENDSEKFEKIKRVFDKYSDTDFRNNSELSENVKEVLKDFEDYNCYNQYLKARMEFAGY